MKSQSQASLDPQSLVRQAFQKTAKPILQQKAELLTELERLPFATQAQKDAFALWVCSARVLRSPEELRIIHTHAAAQANVLRGLMNAGAAPSPEDAFRSIGALMQAASDDLNGFIQHLGDADFGADDKAGVAEIMAAVETMIEKNVKHGEVRVIFTTDEEIGNGVDGLDVQELGCDYGYTVDGGPLGEIEFENFNAASAVLTVHGVGVHPGSAKNVMINAATAAMTFHAMLPEDEVPEKTDGYEGFFHLTEMSGSVTEATLRYIIRDHDRERFEEKKALFADCAARLDEIYGNGTAEARINDSYYNMKEKILPHFHLIERAENAFRANGVEPQCVPIRGGTDGARLSWDGLPCPNLSTGGYNYHGVREWIPADSLEAMTNVLVTLTESFAE